MRKGVHQIEFRHLNRCSVALMAYDHHWRIERQVWKSDPLLDNLPMQVRRKLLIANKGNQVYNPQRLRRPEFRVPRGLPTLSQ
jgi:hypothetical protein